MFWNSGSHRVYGRHLRGSDLSPEEAIVHMDSGWDGFMSSIPADDDLVKMDGQQLAEVAGLNELDFSTVIANSINRWRLNPAGSLINIVKIEPGSAGQPLFRDIREQSHILAAAMASGANLEGGLRSVADPETRKPWKLTGDYYAMTAMDKAADKVNALARAFKLWEAKNQAQVRLGIVKLPKKIYRGIRATDISLKDIDVESADNHYVRTALRTLAKRDVLVSTTLAEASRTDVLSFTSSEKIAQYFTRKEGFVIEVDPRDLLIVSSCATDEALDSNDIVTGKHEREWIMRTGSYRLKQDNICLYDEDTALVMRDPRCVELLSGFNKVRYKMNDMTIRAHFSWNSAGTGGKVAYRSEDANFYWAATRAEFKKEHGFDPIPKPGQDVEVIECWSEDSVFSTKTPIPEWRPEMDTKLKRSA